MHMQKDIDIMINCIFEGQPENHNFRISSNQFATYLQYNKIRKKILSKYNYTASSKQNIQLIILNFYTNYQLPIPVELSKNYTFIVSDMIQRGINQIKVRIVKLGQLKLKKKRESKAPVEFDSQGSVQSIQNQEIRPCLDKNRPNMLTYQQKSIVRCIFCHKSSKNSDSKKISGPFYGPFAKKSYAHLLCLLWCSYVYLDDDNNLQDVQKAINATRRIKCNYCHQKGASFYCHALNCKKGGHYVCALNNSWLFDWVNYQSYCPSCKQQFQPVVQNSSLTKTLTLVNMEIQSNYQKQSKYEQMFGQVQMEQVQMMQYQQSAN